MLKYRIICFLAMFLFNLISAWGQVAYYYDYLRLANKAIAQNDYTGAAGYFALALERYEGCAIDRMDYARVLKILGEEKRSIDQMLFAIDHFHQHDYANVLKDTCFQRWEHPEHYYSFLYKADSTVTAHLVGFNTYYRAQLLEIQVVDQSTRRAITQLEVSEQISDTVMSKVWKALDPIDSLNTQRLIGLIAAYGYPDLDVVGPDANKAAWLVILHSDLQFKETLFPLLKASCDRGQTPMKYYAYVHDRLINQRGITETKYVCSGRLESDGVLYFRAENPSCVNLWRESVGLPPEDTWRKYEPCSVH